MGRYIAVDSGKQWTKVAKYDPERELVKQCYDFKFATRYEISTFEEDNLPSSTYLVQIDDDPNVYKIGADAMTPPDMVSSKSSIIHKVCTLGACALNLHDFYVKNKDNKDAIADIKVAIGVPLSICREPEQRNKYKSYILGEEDAVHTVRYKLTGNAPIEEVKFRCVKRNVYPEGSGIIYEHPEIFEEEAVGIIDIGNLNTNNTYTFDGECKADKSFTGVNGGEKLIAGLRSELNTKFADRGIEVDDDTVIRLLAKPSEARMLKGHGKDDDTPQMSKSIIDNYLLNYVKNIRRDCEVRGWSMSQITLVFVGGTTFFITDEIKKVFGEDVIIPQRAEMMNVRGFLKFLCSADDIDISLIEEQIKSLSEKDKEKKSEPKDEKSKKTA